jgi:hypothetical protein
VGILRHGGPLLVELLGGCPTPTTRQASGRDRHLNFNSPGTTSLATQPRWDTPPRVGATQVGVRVVQAWQVSRSDGVRIVPHHTKGVKRRLTTVRALADPATRTKDIWLSIRNGSSVVRSWRPAGWLPGKEGVRRAERQLSTRQSHLERSRDMVASRRVLRVANRYELRMVEAFLLNTHLRCCASERGRQTPRAYPPFLALGDSLSLEVSQTPTARCARPARAPTTLGSLGRGCPERC